MKNFMNYEKDQFIQIGILVILVYNIQIILPYVHITY